MMDKYVWCYSQWNDMVYLMHVTEETVDKYYGEYYRFDVSSGRSHYHSYQAHGGELIRRNLTEVTSHEREWQLVSERLMTMAITLPILHGKFQYRPDTYHKYGILDLNGSSLYDYGWRWIAVLHITEAYPTLIVCEGTHQPEPIVFPIYSLIYNHVRTVELQIDYYDWVRACLYPDILLS